jgi:hypothetical protein
MWYCIVLYCFGINEEIPEVKNDRINKKTKKWFEIVGKTGGETPDPVKPGHVSSMIKQFETGNVNIEELKTQKKLKKRLTD